MGQVHSRQIRGALAFYEGHQMRLVDAIGPNVVKYELKPEHAGQHAGATATDPPGWTTTVVEVGAGTSEVEASDEAGIAWELVTAAGENDGISLQKVGESFRLNANRHLALHCKIEVDEATQDDLFVGLAITDTALLGGITDGVYFEKLDGAATFSAVTEKDSVEETTAAVGTLVANTAIQLDIYYDGAAGKVYFFVDGTRVATHSTTIPDDEALRLSLELLAGSAVARRAKLHDLRVIQIS